MSFIAAICIVILFFFLIFAGLGIYFRFEERRMKQEEERVRDDLINILQKLKSDMDDLRKSLR